MTDSLVLNIVLGGCAGGLVVAVANAIGLYLAGGSDATGNDMGFAAFVLGIASGALFGWYAVLED